MNNLTERDQFTLVIIITILIAIVTACSLMWYLLHLSLERVKDYPNKSKLNFLRFVLPALASLMLMVKTSDIRMSLLHHTLWLIFLGVVLPFWLIWSSLKEVLYKRLERISIIITAILIINACLFTTGWAYAKRSKLAYYSGSARIVDYFPNGRSSANQMKVNLEWECNNGEFYCHDNQVVSCNDDFTGSELRNTFDYDMTIYNSDSFLDCEDGFDQDTWSKYRWNRWGSDDDNENWDDDTYETNQNNSPYMMIRGNCKTCEIDRHSSGNMLRAKRNRLMIPLWILTCFAVAFSVYSSQLAARRRKRTAQATRTSGAYS